MFYFGIKEIMKNQISLGFRLERRGIIQSLPTKKKKWIVLFLIGADYTKAQGLTIRS
jgi:hypothetical protein